MMKKVFFVLSSLLLLLSCTENDMEELTVNAESFEFIITNELLTRCAWVPSGNISIYQENGLPGEGCPGDFRNFYIMILNDGEIIYTKKLKEAERTVSFSGDTYIESLESFQDENERYGWRLTLNKKTFITMDPSKIEFILSAGGTWARGYITDEVTKYAFKETDDIQKAYLENQTPQSGCNYYARQQLSSENNWNLVNKRITLKRLNSDIYIVSAVKNTDELVYSVLSPIDNLFEIEYIKNTTWYNYNTSTTYRTSSHSYRYYIDKDITYYSLNGLTSYGGVTRYFNPCFYNENTYYFLSYLPILVAPDKTEILEDKDRVLKYLFLLKKTSTSNEDNTVFYYNVLPLPENGVKPNTRYIYYLGEEFNLWENKTSLGEIKKSIETRNGSNPDIQSKGFQIIEQSMDEPFPFEIIEEEKKE